MSSTKYAILIGCNYSATPSSKLYGCINDIINVQNILIDAYGYLPKNITMLRDDTTKNRVTMPTRANILATLNAAMSASSNYSELIIHYSGHGTQVKDVSKDESDGMDEAIVPCDYNTAGFITDDELYAIINKSKCRTLIFFDSCHSGSACDLPYSIQYNKGAYVKSVSSKNINMTNPAVIMISGCRDPQTSADAYNDVSTLAEGAFTMSLIRALRQNDHNVDIMKLYGDICYGLINSGYSQLPVLSSSVVSPAYKFTRAGPVVQVSVVDTTVKPVVVNTTVKKTVNSPKQLLMGNMNMLIHSSR